MNNNFYNDMRNHLLRRKIEAYDLRRKLINEAIRKHFGSECFSCGSEILTLKNERNICLPCQQKGSF